MAVYRVERTRDYTVMCNYHLKDKALSLKAKGLLSMMLSMPEEWNYSTRGLAAICKEPVEPEPDTDTPDTVPPDTDSPYTGFPDMVEPDAENRPELNIKKSRIKKSSTHGSNIHSILPPCPPAPTPPAEGRNEVTEKREEIREQIEYGLITNPANREQVDEFVEIMLEVALSKSPIMKIGRNAEYPTALVQQRFERINSSHIEKVLDAIRENTTRVWNTRAYLLAALFNAPSTTDNHYTMLVNHDMNGG